MERRSFWAAHVHFCITFIAKNISLHCRVLKTLGRQLKVDNPDHSAEALDVAQELQEQSNQLFIKIGELLPSARGRRDGLSFKQKLMWNFRKTRMDYLVGQLEYLKSTVTLLLRVLSSVRKLRKYRKSKKKSPELKQQVGEELMEAQNLLYERYQAEQNLSVLTAQTTSDDIPTIAYFHQTALSKSGPHSHPNQGISSLTRRTLAEIDEYATGLAGSDSRALVLQKTTVWLAQLYEHWTNLSSEKISAENAPLGEVEVEALISLTASLATVSESPDSHENTPNDKSEVSEYDSREDAFHFDLRGAKMDMAVDTAGAPAKVFKPDFNGIYFEGEDYENCIAVLSSPTILGQLEEVERQLVLLKEGLHPSYISGKEQHDLLTRQKELKASHEAHELNSLRKAYIHEIVGRLSSSQSLMEQFVRDKIEARKNRDWHWYDDLSYRHISWTEKRVDWLFSSRVRYGTWREGNDLKIGPHKKCPCTYAQVSHTQFGKSYIKAEIQERMEELHHTRHEAMQSRDMYDYNVTDSIHRIWQRINALEVRWEQVEKCKTEISIIVEIRYRGDLAHPAQIPSDASTAAFFARISALEAPFKSVHDARARLKELRVKHEDAKTSGDLRKATRSTSYHVMIAREICTTLEAEADIALGLKCRIDKVEPSTPLPNTNSWEGRPQRPNTDSWYSSTTKRRTEGDKPDQGKPLGSHLLLSRSG